MGSALRLSLLTAVVCLADASANANDRVVDERSGVAASALEVEITPFYGWIPGMTGNVAVFGTKVGLDVTPLDIAENIGDLLPLVDGLYLGGGEIRYQQLGLLYDILYMDVSLNQGIDGKLLKGSFGVNFQQTTATLAATYRLFKAHGAYLDGVAGVRIWDIQTAVQLDTNILSATLADGDRWIDPRGELGLTTAGLYPDGP